VHYSTSGAAIGGLTNGTNYKVVEVGGPSGSAIKLGDSFTGSGSNTVSFKNNGSNPSTIVRNDGHNWSEFGFAAGQTIVISSAGKAGNDGTFHIQSVSGNMLTLQETSLVTDTSGAEFVIGLDPGSKSDATLHNVTHSLIKTSDLPM